MIELNNCKINIVYKYSKGAWGGGNQFLKAVRGYFLKINNYEENAKNSNAIIFNSHHCFEKIILLKFLYPKKIFIHRLDGPVDKYKGSDSKVDELIFLFNNYISDGNIFQSEWSKKENLKNGLEKIRYEDVIINAPNSDIFNRKNKTDYDISRMKIISTSWSCNMNKGFEIYQWLDENLNFTKYEMTFVGNSPIKFKNIIMIDPLNSVDLSNKLKESDIFITASKYDPCSNSLIEALHSGIPAIGLNDGGHPELIGKGGLVFNTKEEILEKLDELSNNYSNYKNNINLLSIDEIGNKYYQFIKNIYIDSVNGNYVPKRISFVALIRICVALFRYKIRK